MSTTVDLSFVKNFQGEVHQAYQRMGSKLRGTVRTKNNIVGSSTVFQTVGKGTASTKARHGKVPVMNVDHGTVECQLYDYYAGDWIDSLDELKTNVPERHVVAEAGAYALGRKTDELIIDALATATQTVGDYSTGLTKNLVLSAFEKLNGQDVPDDGQRFGVVGPHQWNELLNLQEFSDAHYVGDLYPWLKGTETRKWLGIVWIMHTGLPLASTDDRDVFIYHKTAVGHASGADVKTDVTWHGDRASFFANNMMSQGAGLIDNTGVVKIKCDDDATIS
ncbi:MAG: phage capsid protein [Alphaproteobacteria bacterium]